MPLPRVLVTGASGFVGRAVAERLALDGYAVRAPIRNPEGVRPIGVECVSGVDVGPASDWRRVLDGAEIIVHCAARVHVMREKEGDPRAEFKRINVDGTLNLARQAAEVGVRRFIFLSSIGVNGNETRGRPFSPADEPAPHSAYAESKHQAEISLRNLALQTGLQVIIIRPPLVYGPRAPGNFNRLLRALHRGLPMPFGSVVNNRRSLVALDNLVDLIAVATHHPAATNQTILVSDGRDVSTAQLLTELARALGKDVRLLKVPVWMLVAAAALVGKRDLAQQLCGSLQIDISSTRSLLGWNPPVTFHDAVRDAAQHFLAALPKS